MFVSVQTYGNVDGVCIPAEIAICEFNLKHGIIDKARFSSIRTSTSSLFTSKFKTPLRISPFKRSGETRFLLESSHSQHKLAAGMLSMVPSPKVSLRRQAESLANENASSTLPEPVSKSSRNHFLRH